MFPRDIQKFISAYQIFGLIPLDKTLHFFIGMLITILMRLCNQNMKRVLGVLLVIVITKEIIDLNTLQSSILETFWDALVTFIYPVIILIVIEIKKRGRV